MSHNREEFRWESLLGSIVAQKDPFFEQTACMSEEWRETVGYCEAGKIVIAHLDLLNDPNPDFQKILNVVVIPVCQKLGISTWKRDVVTDLAMKVRNVRQVSDAK